MKKSAILFFLLITIIAFPCSAQSDSVSLPEMSEFWQAYPLLSNSIELPDVQELWMVNPEMPFGPEGFIGLPIAQAEPSPEPLADPSEGVPEEEEIPASLIENKHFLESQRLKTLSEEAFEYGDYDLAASLAAQAAKEAELSDEYVALRLLQKRTNDAIFAANSRLNWARSINAEKSHPDRMESAENFYNDAISLRANSQWEAARESADKVVQLLADVRDVMPLPKTYIVRTWAETRDCFWNIAGYSFIYGDPTKWPQLYEANKSKLRQPNNPHLLHPGTVLTIPSLRGEYREGAWVKGRSYDPLPSRR
jgi:hypothetical protein